MALVQFAESLFPKCRFIKKTNRWVADPNFVTFDIHWKRAKNVALSLRGDPTEFDQAAVLPLKRGMGGYSECTVTNPAQLAAAASYISRAAEIYSRGRTRIKKRPIVKEQNL